MNISINKEMISLPAETTVTDLLERLDIKRKHIAVEINMEIIPKSEFDEYRLKENDNVEIIRAVGGG
tara:strand:- start:1049 stop:1249 length:201 start_codon:yes stop_codon:yes gene_type:complete